MFTPLTVVTHAVKACSEHAVHEHAVFCMLKIARNISGLQQQFSCDYEVTACLTACSPKSTRNKDLEHFSEHAVPHPLILHVGAG